MQSKDLALTGSLVFLLTLSALGANQVQGASFEGAALLEPAQAALEVPLDEDGKLQLSDVLARFQEVTDWTVLMSEEVSRLVERSSPYSSGPLRAEPAAVLPVVEAVLKHSNFVFTLVREDPPRILALNSIDTIARTSARQDAIYVPIHEVPRFAEHRAFLIQTVLPLPNIDVRTLSNSMRGIVLDPNSLQILPIGDSSQLLLQGFGSSVATLVEMLRAADRYSASDGAKTGARSRPAKVPRARDETLLPALGDQDMTLFELVRSYAEKTDATLLLSDETKRLLEATQLGLGAAMTVTGAELSTMVEALLIQNGFVVASLRNESPRLFTVQSLDAAARTSAGSEACYVDAGSIQSCTARPATLFVTVIDLPHTDVRMLSNSMRGMVVDPNTRQIVPVGDSGSLILGGFGGQLARTTEMLKRVDAEEAARPKPVEPAVQAAPAAPGDE